MGGPKPSQPLPLRGASCSSVPTVPTDLLFLLCRCSYCSYRPLLLLLLCSYCTVRTVRTVPLFLLYCLYCSSLPTVRCYCSSVPAVSTPKKYKATYFIGSKTNVSKSTRKKEDKRKARKRSSLAVKNRKSRASVIFLSLGGGHQLMVNMSQRSMECHRSIMLIQMFLVCLCLTLIRLV